MLWAFVVLAVLELVAIHLLLAVRWPWLAWSTSLATALFVAWLLHWVLGWKRHPHLFDGRNLTLQMGSLRRIVVPIEAIDRIVADCPADVLKLRDTRNLVPIAHPNRIVELCEPCGDRRKTRRIAIRLDDPAAFDTAMREAGVSMDLRA